MSQASRRHALRHETERRQVARELAPFAGGEPDDECSDCMGTGDTVRMQRVPGTTRRTDTEWGPGTSYETETVRSPCEECGGTGIHDKAAHVARGGPFNVHAARAHALEILAMEQERVVFEDWTRERGLGPENRERGAFGRLDGGFIMRVVASGQGPYQWAVAGVVVCVNVELGRPVDEQLAEAVTEQVDGYQAKADGGRVHVQRHAPGGWPGKLAREWAYTVECDECENGLVDCGCCDGEVAVKCEVCREARSRKRRAPMGRALARLGQRILDALEGQPSECQRLTCHHGRDFMRSDYVCPDCYGSGHNLRGVLPPVKRPPFVRRRLADILGAAMNPSGRRSWLHNLDVETSFAAFWVTPDAQGYRCTPRTRVCPRGEHRPRPSAPRQHNQWRGWNLDQRISARGAYDTRPRSRRPSWERGEIEHARQRREREARRGELGQAADNGAWLVRARWAAAQYIEANKVEANAAGCEAIEAVIMAELGDAVAGARVFITDHEAGRMDITLIAHSEMAPLDLRGTFTL